VNSIYFKDFDRWHIVKKETDKKKDMEVFFHEREIWWCTIGTNIGSEIDGKSKYFERPVLIIKKFNKTTLWIVPITSKPKIGKYYYTFNWNKRDQSVVLSQLKLISVKRLGRRMGIVSEGNFLDIKSNIVGLLK